MPALLSRLYNASPRKVVVKLGYMLGRRQPVAVSPRRVPQPISRSFLESPVYAELMSRHLAGWPTDDGGLHEAQHDTRSYRFRHFEAFDRLGIFRWRGLQRNLATILEAIAPVPGLDSESRPPRVIDFGGAACPLGFGSALVDLLPTDVWGKPVPYRSLEEIEGQVDVIFSSHTLEHVPQLDEILAQMAAKLAPGGRLILHVPAWTCRGWWAGIHRNSLHQHHVWTFGLSGSTLPRGIPRYRCFDATVADHIPVTAASYCGDDSILLVATRGN